MEKRGVRRKTLVNAVASPLLQNALANLVKDIPDLRLVGSARDALESFTLVQNLRPDLIVLDHTLAPPLKDLMRRATHQPRVLLLSSRQHPGTNPACGSGCACGFVRDRAATAHIRAILRLVAKCEVPSPNRGHASCKECPVTSTLALPRLPISEREYEVFVRIGHGEGNSAIATALGVSVKTIETHRESIKRKLGLDSAHALLNAAICWRDGEFTADDVPMHLMNGKLM